MEGSGRLQCIRKEAGHPAVLRLYSVKCEYSCAAIPSSRFPTHHFMIPDFRSFHGQARTASTAACIPCVEHRDSVLVLPSVLSGRKCKTHYTFLVPGISRGHSVDSAAGPADMIVSLGAIQPVFSLASGFVDLYLGSMQSCFLLPGGPALVVQWPGFPSYLRVSGGG